MKPLGIGIAGLGRAFTLMLPAFAAHPGVRLVAAADPREEARARFASDFGERAYESVQALCADPAVEAVYVATPHEHHAEHAICAMRAGKHVLVEKPMAISLAEAQAMLAVSSASGRRIVVGPSHSFDAPIARTRSIVASGAYGAVRMIHAAYYTDFLYRPRRPEELDTMRGGGVLFSQAAHQVDMVRLLAGRRATSVRAMAGAWDPRRATEGAYAAVVAFEDGVFASLTYSGYAHYDGDEAFDGVGELGRPKPPDAYGAARRAIAALPTERAEADAKHACTYGGPDFRAAGAPPWHEHFGQVIVSCEGADLRPTPRGVWIYGDTEKTFERLDPPTVPRAEVVDELCAAVHAPRPTLHRGEWGLATLELCLAMLASAQQGHEVSLQYQCAP